MKKVNDKEHLMDFGDYDSSASLEKIQLEVDKYSKLGYDDFSVEID